MFIIMTLACTNDVASNCNRLANQPNLEKYLVCALQIYYIVTVMSCTCMFVYSHVGYRM